MNTTIGPTSIAFYAPLKSPRHPRPSGDRAIARALMRALEGLRTLEGHSRVELVSELRMRDGAGKAQVQAQLAQKAQQEALELITAKRRWSLWLTYHNYYKAPDLIGPQVSKALGIPYVLVEATRAPWRLGGPWDRFARAAEAACDHAQAIFYFTARDYTALAAGAPKGQHLLPLAPFLARETLPPLASPPGPVILVAGMMRHGDKLASYQIIAQVLGVLRTPDWRLLVAGDGPAQQGVAAMFAPFAARVQFLGRLDAKGMEDAYQKAAVLLWPGVNEAFGMVYLEAQAAGCPVIAEDRAGVRDVVPAQRLAPPDRPEALAARVDALLQNPGERQAAARQAQAHVQARHLLGHARTTLYEGLRPWL